MTVGVGWLPETAFFYLLIFARVGSILMLMPALGEQAINARSRLGFALVFALVLHPLLAPTLPRLPATLPEIVVLLIHELVIGLIIGAMARIAVMSATVAGSIIAFQTGLSVAQTADPTQGGVQGAVIGTFMSMVGITLIFATDLHHLALAAIYDSYMVFTPTDPLMLDDVSQMVIRVVSSTFSIGVQMSAPFIVFGLVFNLGSGILARLMPQLQVYYLLMPANVFAGLILFALLLVMMMGLYLMHFQDHLAMLRT